MPQRLLLCVVLSPTIRLELTPSRWLYRGLGTASLLALASLGPLSLPLVCKMFLAMLVIFMTGWHYVRYLDTRSRWFIRCLECDAEGNWCLVTLAGRMPVHLVAGFMHPVLVVLVFALEQGGRRVVVLPPDAAPADPLRRLRRHVLVGRFANAVS